MVLERLDIHMQNNKLGHLPYIICKAELAYIKDFNVKPIQLLEKILGKSIMKGGG
jgi:hypothetical protein